MQEDPNKELLDQEEVIEQLLDEGKVEAAAKILSEFDEIEAPEEEDGYDAIAHEE